MKTEDFNILLDSILEKTRKTLGSKAKEYATDSDRLHNFKVGAKINGSTTIREAHNYLTKHLIKYIDWVLTGYTPTEAEAAETLGDIRNYTILEEAIWKEERDAKNQKEIEARLPIGAGIDPKGVFVNTPRLDEEGQLRKTDSDKLIDGVIKHCLREDAAVLKNANNHTDKKVLELGSKLSPSVMDLQNRSRKADAGIEKLQKDLADLDTKCFKLFQDLAVKLTETNRRISADTKASNCDDDLLSKIEDLGFKLAGLSNRLQVEANHVDTTEAKLASLIATEIGKLKQEIADGKSNLGWNLTNPVYTVTCKTIAKEIRDLDGKIIGYEYDLMPKGTSNETSNVSCSNSNSTNGPVHKG